MKVGRRDIGQVGHPHHPYAQAGDPAAGASAQLATLLIADMDGPGGDVAAPRSGYLQYIQHRTLVRIAAEKGAVVHLRYRPGHFLTVRVPAPGGGSVARCYSLSSSPHAGDRPTITVKRMAGGHVSNWIGA